MSTIQTDSQSAKILKLLKRQGSATSQELNMICYRYGARILDLRKEGHLILSERVRQGVWRYTYQGEQVIKPVSFWEQLLRLLELRGQR